jgi:conjugal transfer pilus assembly protein TraV
MYKLIAMCAAAFVLSGCSNMLSIGSTEYGCKGMPEGVSCMSAKDVYSATENENYKTTLQAEQQAAQDASDKGKKVDGEPSTPSFSYAEGADNAPIPMRARNPLPIRTQAVVMRIAVDPWEDENGDLYVPGFIYTEIEPRRWEIGSRQNIKSHTLKPLN